MSITQELKSFVGSFDEHESNDSNIGGSDGRDLEGYLRDAGVLKKRIDKPDGVVFEIVCLNDENHTAQVGEKDSGALWASCHHNSCADKHSWQDVKASLGDPPWQKKNPQGAKYEPARDEVKPYELPKRRTLKSIRENPTPEPDSVIEGLVYRGEYIRLAADSKAKKTWLAMLISLSVANGLKLFDQFQCNAGKVLHIDAELLDFGFEDRITAISEKLVLDPQREDNFEFVKLRTEPASFDQLFRAIKREYQRGELDLIVLDSQYRFYGVEVDENSNGQMTALQQEILRIASELDVAILLIHHSTKGPQAAKKVQDVGSGAGSQARFADVLLAFREHEIENCVVLEGITRHRRGFNPMTLCWGYPLWVAKDGIEATVKRQQSDYQKGEVEKDEAHKKMILDRFKDGRPFTWSDCKKIYGSDQSRNQRLISELVRSGQAIFHSNFKRPNSSTESDHYTLNVADGAPESYSREDYLRDWEHETVATKKKSKRVKA